MGAHITLPECSLKHFADEENKISYYDLSAGEVKECYPGSYNTETDYFPDDFEKWLNREEERHIGMLHKKLTEFESTQRGFQMDGKLKKRLVRIIATQTIRIPDIFESLMDTDERNREIDLLWELNIAIGNVNPYTLAARDRLRQEVATLSSKKKAFYTQGHIEELVERACRKFANYAVHCAIISESVIGSFLLTPTLYFQDDNRNRIYIPVSPRHAYVLLPIEESKKYIDEQNRQRRFDIDKDELDSFVPHCISTTKTFKDKHLIGTKQYLLELIESGLLQTINEK